MDLIIIFNVGGTSIKCSVYYNKKVILKVNLNCFGLTTQYINVVYSSSKKEYSYNNLLTYQQAIKKVIYHLNVFFKKKTVKHITIAHRVKFASLNLQPKKIDKRLIKIIEEQSYLAYNHNSFCLEVIKAVSTAFKGAIQVAIFDSQYFEEYRSYNPIIPFYNNIKNRYELFRDGHHGLACESIMTTLIENKVNVKENSLIICHLGSGVSVSLIVKQKPIFNSMAYSSIDGPVMNTRSGNIPPGIILKLIYNGYPAHRLSKLLSQNSGLYSIAGLPNNSNIMMVDILKNPDYCKEYVNSIVFEILKCTVEQPHIDSIIFSGGIPNQFPPIIKLILKKIQKLGFSIIDSKVDKINKTEKIFKLNNTGKPVFYINVNEQDIIYKKTVEWLKSERFKKDRIIMKGYCLCPGISEGILTKFDHNLAVARDTVIVVDRISPKIALHSRNCAAIICREGEISYHGAAFCRELSIPTISRINVNKIYNSYLGKKVIVDSRHEEVQIEK